MPSSHNSLQQGFSSLKFRNFRLWFSGQLASLVGTWMQTTAMGFLMYELTHSPAYLGFVGFANGIPALLFALFGGVTSDRFERRKVLMVTQISMMCIAGFLTVITFTGKVQPWHLIVIAFVNGIANAFDAPARQAFVHELVPPEFLTNAIALNSTMFNSAVALGPTIAGIVYAAFGPVICFGINTISFLAILFSLMLMNLPKKQRDRAVESSFRAEIKEGLIYILHHRVIRTLLLTVAISNILGMGYQAMLPAWAVSVLHGNSITAGILQSARGIGSVLGALTIAMIGRTYKKGKILNVASFIYPAFLLLFAGIHWLPCSIFALLGAGLGIMMLINTANALIQTHVENSLRGRIMSVYSMAMTGMIPLGSLTYGTLAEYSTVPFAIFIGAIISLLFAVWFTFRFSFIRKLL